MSRWRKWGLVAGIVACCPASFAEAGVYVGIGIPGPYYYRPYCHHRHWYGGYGYYRPYGMYMAPPPVVVGAAPVVVQQPVVVQPAYAPPAPTPAQTPAPLPPPAPVNMTAGRPAPEVMPAGAVAALDLDTCVRQLQNGDESTRATALVNLGKLRAERAVGPMVKALNSDPSPRVREAAARGLGLIASPSSLTALQYAAQADDDPQVRHSAAFAVEVIRGNSRR